MESDDMHVDVGTTFQNYTENYTQETKRKDRQGFEPSLT